MMPSLPTAARDNGMQPVPGQPRDANAPGAGELGQLQAQIDQASDRLGRLRAAIAEAEQVLDAGHATQRVMAANEPLVVSSLQARPDVASAERALGDVSHQAAHDVLTDLPNRLLLMDRFVQAIAAAKRHDAMLAVLFLDLNNFKQINDTLGHAVGDDVLRRAAHCFVSAVRGEDTVSRHGGDEFLILLTEVSQAGDAALVAEKVIAALGAPHRVGDHVIRLTASIGISVYPEDGRDPETLIGRANAAMCRARKHGPGSFTFHGKELLGQRSNAPTLDSLHKPLAHFGHSLAEHERRHGQIRDANEQLILAALDARELGAAAEHAHQQQTAFLAVLAHELRNPLTPIRTAAALLSHVGPDELPRMQAIIERQVAHMSRLISDLFDVSRVNTGKLRLERQRVDMTAIIDEAIAICRPAMDVRLQHFGVLVPARALQVDGDPVRLVQVVSNLLDNASKYTPDGGEIALSVVVSDGTLVLSICDTGIGISPESLSKVFEPFVQDAHATGFNGFGLGIGLTVVRELVEAHGGSVVASSRGSDRGSQFVVTLPLLEDVPLPDAG
jgi:diguanylate cyclase (GGDEF)-like protein